MRKARGTFNTTTCDNFLFFSARAVEADGDLVLEAEETGMLAGYGYVLTSDGDNGKGVVKNSVVEEW